MLGKIELRVKMMDNPLHGLSSLNVIHLNSKVNSNNGLFWLTVRGTVEKQFEPLFISRSSFAPLPPESPFILRSLSDVDFFRIVLTPPVC
jgi:hypothetical protein